MSSNRDKHFGETVSLLNPMIENENVNENESSVNDQHEAMDDRKDSDDSKKEISLANPPNN